MLTRLVLFFWWIQQTAVRYTVALLAFLAIFSKGVGYFQCMIQESTPRLLAYKKPMPLTCVWLSKKSTAAARWSHKAGWLLLHTKVETERNSFLSGHGTGFREEQSRKMSFIY